MQHTAVLLGNSSTLNKRGENPPRCNRTTPADFSLANPSGNAQTIFSFSAVMAFHEALITSSFSYTIFSGMVCCLLSNGGVATSFYQRSANHVSFYLFFYLRNLSYLIAICAPFIVSVKSNHIQKNLHRETTVPMEVNLFRASAFCWCVGRFCFSFHSLLLWARPGAKQEHVSVWI